MSRLPKPLVIVFLFCALVFLAETTWFRARHSLTFDETFYLAVSNSSVLSGELDPRFTFSGVAPLPMLLNYFPSLWFHPTADRLEPWEGALDDPAFITGPRLSNSVLVGLPLLAIVVVWLFMRHGPYVAGLGGGLLACSPTIIAHGGLATTDLCFGLFSLAALLVIAWMAKKPSVGRAACAGIAIGAALAAKYSALFLLPVSGLMLALHLWKFNSLQEAKESTLKISGHYVVLLTAVWITCWGLHLNSTGGPLKSVPLEETAEYSPWLKVLGRGPVADWIMNIAHKNLVRPAPLEGILFQLRHNKEGHPSYLMGESFQFGRWYYFPCAFFFKSTPVELLLTAVLLIGLLRTIPSFWRTFHSWETSRQAMLMGTAVLSGMLLTSRINIGQRYLIMFYPMLIMVSLDLLARSLSKYRVPGAVLAVGLLASQLLSSLSVGPHYLSYFNSFVGGPEEGRWLLEDSNIDWGQDLPELRDFQQDHPEPMLLWYFGSAIPEAYGIRASNLEEFPASVEAFTYAAFSTSLLIGPYGPSLTEEDPFVTLRQITPFTTCGHSIVILDLRSEDVREKLQVAIREYEIIARNDPKHNALRWRSTP